MRVESFSDKLASCHTPARYKSYWSTIHPEPFVSNHSGYTFNSWNLLPAFPQTYFRNYACNIHSKVDPKLPPMSQKGSSTNYHIYYIPSLQHFVSLTKWPIIQMMFPLQPRYCLDEVMLSYYARACGALVKVTEVYAQSTSVPFSVSHIRRDMSI